MLRNTKLALRARTQVQFKLPNEMKSLSSLPGIKIEGSTSSTDEITALERLEQMRQVLARQLAVFRATQISSRKVLHSREKGVWSEAST